MPKYPKGNIPLHQKTLDHFFPGLPPPTYRGTQTLLKEKLKTFRAEYERQFASRVYLGVKPHTLHGNKKRIAYYRDPGFYHYWAYDIERSLAPVGELRLDSYDEEAGAGEHALSGIEVLVSHRRCGIAMQLIKFADVTNMTENHGTRLIVFGGQAYNSRYRLTTDGMKLIRACLDKGILDDEQFLGNVSMQSPEW
jgi:hypothetical protein